MSSNIILSSDDLVICPKCAQKFPIEQGITRQAIEQHEAEYDKILKEHSAKLKEQLSKEAAKNAEKIYKEKIAELTEENSKDKAALQETEARMKKLRKDVETKAQLEFDEERKTLKDDLEQKEKVIKEFRNQEISLRRDRKKLEDEKLNFELDQQRKLDEAKKEIEKKIIDTQTEKFKYKEDEYKKKLSDALEANANLTKKLEQGSNQLHGEVLELSLEKLLHDSFPYDRVEEVSKGVRGADLIQFVCTPGGQVCGSIMWEAKRAQNWSEKWLPKLKDDCMAGKADIAVLVSTVLPRDCSDSFKIYDGVWVISDTVVRPVAETLRVILMESHKSKVANKGKADKAELVYNYLCSPNFAQNVRSVIDAFVHMKNDLDREKIAMNKIWKKRESQLERVTMGMSTMVGELEGIAQDSFHLLDSIDVLALPEGDDE